ASPFAVADDIHAGAFLKREGVRNHVVEEPLLRFVRDLAEMVVVEQVLEHRRARHGPDDRGRKERGDRPMRLLHDSLVQDVASSRSSNVSISMYPPWVSTR